MKKLLWTSAMALTAAACMTACDDSSSGASNSIPEFKTEAALPDTCEMEVAKAGDTYFACFENKWIEVTDSATVEQLKEGLDEDEVKAKLEELEDLLKPATPAKPKSSSSKKTDEDVESSDSEEPESSASEECTGRRCGNDDKSSSSKKPSGGSGNGGSGDSSPSSATSGSGSEEVTPDGLPACNAALKDTVKWTGEFISGSESLPDESTSGKYFACNGTKWAEVTKLHYAFGATCEAFKNRIQQLYDKDYITNPEQYSDPFTEEKVLNSDLNVLTDGNGTVFGGAGRALGRLIPEWNGKTEIYTYNGVIYSSPLCKNDEYTEAPVGASAIRRLCTKNNVGDRGRAYKQQGSTVYGNNYWVCYEKADGTYEWGRGFVDSRTATGTAGDPKKWGDIYRMVNIGEQTWMAENLNYDPQVEGVYCKDDTKEDCGTYGRLYTWDVAASTDLEDPNTKNTDKKICPSGWHTPSADELKTLVTLADELTAYNEENTAGKKLTSAKFEGTDVYGFTAMPSGAYKTAGEGSYYKVGVITSFWSSSFESTKGAYYLDFTRLPKAYVDVIPKAAIAFPVRCIKDAE